MRSGGVQRRESLPAGRIVTAVKKLSFGEECVFDHILHCTRYPKNSSLYPLSSDLIPAHRAGKDTFSGRKARFAQDVHRGAAKSVATL